ncbi:hypothetical protein MAPG_11672, partial [Magnaporthiopsis poae ATCC 64411]
AREWARSPDDGDEDDDEERPLPGGRRRYLTIGEWVREQNRVLAAGAYVDAHSHCCQEPHRPRQALRKTRDEGEGTQSIEQEEEEEEEGDLYGCDGDCISPAAAVEAPGSSAVRKDKRDSSPAEQEHGISTKPTVRATTNSAGRSTLPTLAGDGPPLPDTTKHEAAGQTHQRPEDTPLPASVTQDTEDNTSPRRETSPSLPSRTSSITLLRTAVA